VRKKLKKPDMQDLPEYRLKERGIGAYPVIPG
jgi:hypothetical protein